MGLLSFLSKQSAGDRQRPSTRVRSQAYNATVASNPPVRGNYPVPGNGTSALEGLSRIHGELSDSQLSLDIKALSRFPLPSPVVSLFQDESRQRPSTAPNGAKPLDNRPYTADRPRKGLPRGPWTYTRPQNGSSVPEPPRGRSAARATGPPPVRLGVGPQLLAASSPSGPGPDSPLKGSKDILDAQSEFKPLDFRTRIKAAGARDYGEDVADRNIGQNGVNLESPHVRAFYAQSAGSLAARKGRCVSVADISQLYLNDDTRGRPTSKQPQINSGHRTKSLNSLSYYSFPQRATPPVPQTPTSGTHDGRLKSDSKLTAESRGSRRKSLNSYIPTGSPGTLRPHIPRTGSFSFRNGDGSGRPSLALTRPATAHDPQHRSSFSTIRQASIPREPRSPRTTADSVSFAKIKTGHGGPDHGNTYIDHAHPGGRSFPLMATSRRDSSASAAFAYSGSLHTRQSSVSSSFSRDDAVENTALSYPRHKSQFRSSHDGGSTGTTAPGADLGIYTSDSLDFGARPSISSAHANVTVRESRRRSRSLASSMRTLRLDEVDDVVPVRTSSIRHWSISSTTPTTSETSSNLSQPQSRHTADTSVDLSHSFSAKNSSRGSLTSAIDTSVALSPKTPKSSTFNIDDYISSDDDVSMSPRRPRGEGEEDLLFRDDGFCMGGSQLPGLFDGGLTLPGLSSSFYADEQLSHRPRTSSSLPVGYMQNAFSSSMFNPGAPSPLRSSRKYIIDTAAHYDEDEEGDDDYANAWHRRGEEPQSPGMSPMWGGGLRGTKRLSALGNKYGHPYRRDDVIEEERDMSKIDVSAAVKMRKEAKAKKRAAVAARRRPRTRSRPAPIVVDGDEGHHADTEC